MRLTEAEREGLIEAIQAGAEVAWVEELLTARSADAWDEGYDAGDQSARAVNPEWPEPTRNPYRALLDAAPAGGAEDA
jgi:hypothetical protein